MLEVVCIMGNNKLEPNSLIIYNGKLVLENRVIEGAIIVRHGIIMDVITNISDAAQWQKYRSEYILIDAKGKFVLPGMIDIHCDAIEKEIQPRPNTLFAIPYAFQEFEAKLPIHGITTMFHSVSLGVGLSIRGEQLVSELIDYIDTYNKGEVLARNLIHLRYEVSYLAGRPMLEKLIDEKRVQLLSLMDHAPGIGQYHREGSFERYVMKNQGVTFEEVPPIIEELQQRRACVTKDDLQAITTLAKNKQIPLASHDDDSEQKIIDNLELGIHISEFPITENVARFAEQQKIQLSLGAPNVVRGGSHDGNLSAESVIAAGKKQILCSDYYPSSLLQAVFKIADGGKVSLSEAVKLVTLNPAEAVNMDEQIGSIRIGKVADFILVDHHNQLPSVAMTILNGAVIYSRQRTTLND